MGSCSQARCSCALPSGPRSASTLVAESARRHSCGVSTLSHRSHPRLHSRPRLPRRTDPAAARHRRRHASHRSRHHGRASCAGFGYAGASNQHDGSPCNHHDLDSRRRYCGLARMSILPITSLSRHRSNTATCRPLCQEFDLLPVATLNLRLYFLWTRRAGSTRDKCASVLHRALFGVRTSTVPATPPRR